MIRIPKFIHYAMIDHAKKIYPNEACGLLANQKGHPVCQFFPMKNMDEASISYFMDPKEQLQVFKKMRELGVELCGIFHSHVASEAVPSQKDVRLAFYPVSTLIVSLSDLNKPVLRSFQISEEKVSEEEIQLV